MAKEIKSTVKLEIPAGQATPAPPIGPTLSQYGINMGDFCSKFNEATSDKDGIITPVIITVYKDSSFDFVTKTPPTSELIRRELGIKKGSGEANINKVGKLTQEQLQKIAENKLPDLNTNNIEQAKKIIAGSAKQMGIETEENSN